MNHQLSTQTTPSPEGNHLKSSSVLFLTLTVCAFAGGLLDAQGQALNASPRQSPRQGLDSVRHWNQIAIDASGFDHAGAREQLGPGRASRAMAIVHIAMFDTINAVVGQYQSYTGVRATIGPLSPQAVISQAVHDTLEAAISQVAHDTLASLFTAQVESFDAFLT